MIKNVRQKQINNLYLEKRYQQFLKQIEKQLHKFNLKENFSKVIFLCIGTNKVVGDMVGPIVGEVLTMNKHHCFFEKEVVVYGNLTNTLNFKNAQEIISRIYTEYENPFIITIDAALGERETMERVFVYSGEIKLGSSLNKSFTYHSHIYIKGVVGKYSTNLQENMKTLQNAKLSSILQMSNFISTGLQEVMEKY